MDPKFGKSAFVISLCCFAAMLDGRGYRDAHPTQSDSEMRGKLTDRSLKPIFQDASGGGEWEDIVKGSGSEAFPGRRVVVDIAATNPDGEKYGAGRMTILYPWAKGIPSGRMDETVFTGLYGMKVRGTRRITLPSARCQGPADQPCELAGANPGEVSLVYPNGAPATFTVTLVSVCRPRIVEKTTYSIPHFADKNDRRVVVPVSVRAPCPIHAEHECGFCLTRTAQTPSHPTALGVKLCSLARSEKHSGEEAVMKGNWRTISGTWIVTLAAGAAVLGAGTVSRGVELLGVREFQARPLPIPAHEFPPDINIGALKVTIREWDVPTKGAHPHDPAVGADGALWFTEQMQNKIGRVDPATGAFKEYPLKVENSGPHGLVADREGNIWFTGNFAHYIGKLDPKTGAVTEYKMPDEKAEDPHTAVFDAQGILWFTVQVGNFVGRLEPKSGKVELQKVPTANAHPYGIQIDSHGVPFFCEFASNKLASIDPKTMAIREYVLPEGVRPRRIAIDATDRIYFTDFERGHLGRLDPKTRETKMWNSPGGAGSNPYGIAITPDGMVWYSESGVKPNTLVRFDPKTESFASTTIPSGGGTVRNMAATSDGRVYIACSGVNKVGVVEPAR